MRPKILSSTDAFQDDFVLKMFKYKNSGYYVDLGCGHPFHASNSNRLEQIGWHGICVDINRYNDFSKRNCHYFINDALKLNYEKIFEACNVPQIVDYLSIDIDENSTELLKLIPLNKYIFKIITIEHDAYCRDQNYRQEQRNILNENGYYLLCADVWPDILKKLNLKVGPFEDWWIKKEFFDCQIVEHLKSDNIYGSEIIAKFGFDSLDLFD